MKKVCVFIEQKNGIPTSNSQKIMFMAQTLKKRFGYMVIVLVLDADIDKFLPFLKSINVDVIYFVKLNVMNHCLLHRNEITNLARFLEKINADIVWACNSIGYKVLLPKIAYILNTGLCSACLDFHYDKVSGRIDMVRMAYSDNVFAQIAVHRSRPLMATILDDSKTYTTKSENPCSEINNITNDIILPGKCNVEKGNVEIETIKAADAVCLNTSKVVIGLGNGITEKTDLFLFEKLASLLNNAAIGGTRELVNKQIIPQSCQIGSTGIQIHADLYIAFGISGSPQHIQGIEYVKKIISVNHDPYAAIFQYSDYGIVGDLFEVADYMINYLGG